MAILYFFDLTDQDTPLCARLVSRSVLRQMTPLAVALTNLESFKKNVGEYVERNFLFKSKTQGEESAEK
jgi:hypothetical protein